MLADGSEYRGHYPVDDRTLREFHAPRLAVLADSGADLLACETLPCLREALVLADLLRQHPPLTAWISFSCRDGARNCEGEDVAACAAALQPFNQVAAIGVNCTAPGFVSALLRRMSTATDKPLLAYPNSGEHYEPKVKSWHGAADPHAFADGALEWYAAGARLIGGCCRTTPADIRNTRAVLLGSHPAAP
jgi:homocysteine S-methyltransferase